MKSAKTILAMASLVLWMVISFSCKKENFDIHAYHDDAQDSTHEVLQGWGTGGPLNEQPDSLK